jgi:hypothetical protein
LSVSILFSLFAGLSGVFATEVLSISVDKTVLVVGQSTPITITTTLTVSNLTVESSDNTVVTVDDPPTTALAVGKGTATITVSGTVKGTRYTDTVTIKVRTPTGIVSGENYYIMNSGTEKFLSLVSAYDGNNVSIIGRDRSSSVLSQWTASNIRVDGTGLTQLISVYSNTDRKMYVSGTNLVLYNASGSSTQFAIHRIESGTNQGRYAIRYDNKYVAMNSSGDVYLTTSSSDNIYWTFMAVGKGYADMYGSYITSPEDRQIDTTSKLQTFVDVMAELGYGADGWMNYSAEAAYDLMPDDDICIITGHANAGVIDFCNGTYEGDNISSIAVNVFVKFQYGGKNYEYIDDYTTNELAQIRCILYMGCNSGNDFIDIDGSAYNLVDATFEKGAHCVMGLTEFVVDNDVNTWLGHFLDEIHSGANIQSAIEEANRNTQSITIRISTTVTEELTAMPLKICGDQNQYLHY